MRLGRIRTPVETEAISTGPLPRYRALGNLWPGVRAVGSRKSMGRKLGPNHRWPGMWWAEAAKIRAALAPSRAEHAPPRPSYAGKLGGNLRMPDLPTDTGEQAFEIADTLVLAGARRLLVIDKTASVEP